MPNGWIKLHRTILDWEWFQDGNTFRVFVYLLLQATSVRIKYNGIELFPGEFMAGRKQIARDLGLSEQEVRTAIKHLTATRCLTTRKSGKYTIYKANNWDQYQCANQIINQELTRYQPDESQKSTRLSTRLSTTCKHAENALYKEEYQVKNQCANQIITGKSTRSIFENPKNLTTKQEEQELNKNALSAMPARADFVNFCQSIGYSQTEAKDLFNQLNARNWTDKFGGPITNWRRFVESMKQRNQKLNFRRTADLPDWYSQTAFEPADPELLKEIAMLRDEQNSRGKN